MQDMTTIIGVLPDLPAIFWAVPLLLRCCRHLQGGIPQMSGGSLIDYAWSLAAMDLVEDFEKDFRAALEETFKRTPLRYGWRTTAAKGRRAAKGRPAEGSCHQKVQQPFLGENMWMRCG